jgi:hypothetical protein
MVVESQNVDAQILVLDQLNLCEIILTYNCFIAEPLRQKALVGEGSLDEGAYALIPDDITFESPRSWIKNYFELFTAKYLPETSYEALTLGMKGSEYRVLSKEHYHDEIMSMKQSLLDDHHINLVHKIIEQAGPVEDPEFDSVIYMNATVEIPDRQRDGAFKTVSGTLFPGLFKL